MALVWNWMCPARTQAGKSEKFIPGARFNVRYRSLFSDLLIWESISRATQAFGGEIGEPAIAALGRYRKMILNEGNFSRVGKGEAKVRMFPYYIKRDNLVPAGGVLFRMIMKYSVPDNDTTCVILSSLMRIQADLQPPVQLPFHDEAETERFISHLADHVYGEGRFGQESPSYIGGFLPGDHGVVTWVFDPHNEVDPTSNVNILFYFIQLYGLHPELVLRKGPYFFGRILRFLLNHVENDTLLSSRFQQYYPFGSALFFWWRFTSGFEGLSLEVREALDPKGDIRRIDDYLVKGAETVFSKSREERFNPYDKLLAAPLLLARGRMAGEISGVLLSEESIGHFKENQYELFHLRYPSKILCMPEMFPQAVYLEVLNLLARTA
jgi:hypothetical protein